MSPKAHLSRVENLLDEALQDLKSLNREAPAARCAAALAEAEHRVAAHSRKLVTILGHSLLLCEIN